MKQTTLILILLALGLGGVVYYIETRAVPQQEAAQASERKLFDFEEKQVQALTIKTPEQTFTFERTNPNQADKTTISQWRMKTPQDVPASDPSVSFLLDMLVSRSSDRAFMVPIADIPQYGLDRPQATVDVVLSDGKAHKLVLGSSDFNDTFLYAQIDPPPNPSQQLEVFLVPKDFEYAVQRPLSEWVDS